MKTRYPLTGVAIGPGDPELITMKSFNALKTADVIYYAASKVDGDNITSFSKKILDHYELSAPCQPLLFPMSGKDRTSFYAKAYSTLKEDVQNGLKVCFVTEGDLSFYSTFGYLLKLAKADKLPTVSLPGIPAFIAAGASGLTPIVEEERSLVVIARPKNFEELTTHLNAGHAVVVMKMKVLDGWADYLKQCNRSFVYTEKVGTDEEYITSDYQDLIGRQVPYFALLLFPGIA